MAFIRSGGSRVALIALSLAALVAGAGGMAFYLTLLHDLPDLEHIEDYRPPLTSRVLDRDGRLIGEFFTERRRLVSIDEIPRHAQLAFVSAEDSAFFEHSGIDFRSILRAAWVDLTAREIRQGASTITMQLVKQLLLSPERRFRRKIREMVLARRLEQHFSKREILFLYLNHIYFGRGAHGIAEAAFSYFDKDVRNLSVSEAALLAGLPQRPSGYSPFRNPEKAEKRRRYVLGRMHEDGVIDTATYREALAAPPQVRPPAARQHFGATRYFVEEVRRDLVERLGDDAVLKGGLTIETTLELELQKAAVEAVQQGLRDHDHRQGYRGPLRRVDPADLFAEIERVGEHNDLPGPNEVPEPAAQADAAAPADTEIADAAEAEVPAAIDRSADRIPYDEPLVGVVTAVDPASQLAQISLAPGVHGQVDLQDVAWAREPDARRRPRSVKHIEQIFHVGDVALFVRLVRETIEPTEAPAAEFSEADAPPPPPRLALHQEPQVEGALISLDVASGDVLAMVGGYDFERSEFNRVTQSRRQPGSAFKPIIYGAAISRGYSPVATLYDRPVVYEDPISGFVWRPQNYSRHFYGPIPLRTALARSVNNATVHLFRDVGVDFVIDFARRLGIQSPLNRDLSLALGSSGVSLLELTSAYAVYPNQGRRVLPRYIRRVVDREGRTLFEDLPLGEPPPPVLKPLLAEGEEPAEPEYPDAEILPTDQVISPAAAYLMYDLLKAVVFDPRGTGWRLKALHRPVGGKTGTTNDQADAWFMGFTPDIVTGVWVGHDESRVLGWGETGSRAAAPIWVQYMRTAVRDRPVRNFEEPQGIEVHTIDRTTGLLADATSDDAYFQPFIVGTAPTQTRGDDVLEMDARRALREDSF